MTSTTIIYILTVLLLGVSFKKSKDKTKQVLKIALKKFIGLIQTLLPILLAIGISLSIISPELINKIMGNESGGLGIIAGLLIGSLGFLPSFIVYPLGGSLIEHGAGLPQVAGLVASMMSVGFLTLSMEIDYFGKKVAITRNILGLLISVVFVIAVLIFI